MQRNENFDRITTTTCYVILKPIFFRNTLGQDEIDFILNKVIKSFPSMGYIDPVFLDKEQAKLYASQFTTKEAPNLFNRKKHELAKPVLCLTLDRPIDLIEESECVLSNQKGQHKIVSYTALATDLQQWQKTDWMLLINNREITLKNNQIVLNNSSVQDSKERCFMM